MTPHAQRETRGTAAVVRIDLRATATGPDAIDAGSVGPDTLAALQRKTLRERTSERDGEIVDVGRLLVVDDIATVVPHAAAYQHLVVGATTGQLLCVVVGSPTAAAAIDRPEAMMSPNTAVLWIGDPRGVGWRLGMSTTTRLAVSAADLDGHATLAELIDILADQEVFDGVAHAAARLPEQVGAPAIIRPVRWPGPALPPEPPRPAQPPTLAPSEEEAPTRTTDLPGYADARSLLITLWSYGPALARCVRLLAEAETAASQLSRLPGVGGRRAWQSVIQAGQACSQFVSSGPAWLTWPPPLAQSTLPEGLTDPTTPTMWSPAAALLPLLAFGCALVALVYPLSWVAAIVTWVAVLPLAYLIRAGLPGPSRRPSRAAAALVAVATAFGVAGGAGAAVAADPLLRLGIGQAAADAGSATLGVLTLVVVAFTWWRGATRRWRHSLRCQDVRDALESLPGHIASHGVDYLSQVAATWYRAEWRRLVGRVRRRSAIRDAGLLLPPAPVALPSAGTPAFPVARLSLEETRAALASAERIIAATVEDEEFLQLTAPDQLPLLDGTPLTARLVKFAPAEAKDTVGSGHAGQEIRWTATGDRVGVIRLVGLRPGVLRIAGVRDGSSTEVTGTVTILGGADGALAALTEWLLDDDELRGRIQPEPGDGVARGHDTTGPSLSVRLPRSAVRTLAIDVTDWLRGSDDTTSVGFTDPVGPPGSKRKVTVSAAEVKVAGESQTEAILDQIVVALTGR